GHARERRLSLRSIGLYALFTRRSPMTDYGELWTWINRLERRSRSRHRMCYTAALMSLCVSGVSLALVLKTTSLRSLVTTKKVTGLSQYDLSSPQSALRSMAAMTERGDLASLMEVQFTQNQKGIQALRQLEVKRTVEHEGKVL